MSRLPNEPRLPRAVACAISSALFLIGVSSCQAVFGDYRIDDSQVPPPSIVCERGETRCQGAVLQACAPDRLGWQDLETCRSPDLCNLTTDSCDPCVPGEFQCNDAELRRCSDNRTWEFVATCVTSDLCTVGENRMQGKCAEATCTTAGQYQCEAGRLQRCARGLNRWEDIELCETPQLCNAEFANEQAALRRPVHCMPAECKTGDFLCAEGRLGQCSASLLTWDELARCDPSQCNVQTGDCTACTPGAVVCSGAELMRCTAGGTWQVASRCASAALCDPIAGACKSPGCEPAGAVVCEATLKLRRCKPDQTGWEDIAVCDNVGLCNADERRCEPAACEKGAKRCVGARFEACRDDLTGWEVVQRCDAGTLCDPTMGCRPGPCNEGTARCNERYLERCTEGQWQRVQSCETPALCDVTAQVCKPPVCGGTLPRHQCSGTNLKVCKPGRDDFMDFLTCASADDCDANSGSCR